MEGNKNIIMKKEEIFYLLIKNCLKMFERRGILKDIDSILEKYKNTDELKITQNKIFIKIIEAKINSISKNSPLDDFLSNDMDYKKIFIFKYPVKKVYKTITEEYANTEVFFFYNFLEDIYSKDYCSEHILLTSKEKEELLEQFNAIDLSKINHIDIMSRYFNAQPGDVFRIIRKNTNSGNSVVYRIVVKGGDINILFS